MSNVQPLFDEEIFEPAAVADPDPWPVMAPVAFHGLAGEIISVLAPETEADPVAMLLHFLVIFGNILGRKPCCRWSSKRHFPVLYALVIGQTSKARKGTAADIVLPIFEKADPDWVRNNIASGISSGEGILHLIRDPIYSMKKGEEELADPGVSDKRVLLLEREFSSCLDAMQRPGNKVSHIIRDAWDSPELLNSLVKHSPTRATRPHISICGHITLAELRKKLVGSEISNGFANRYLFALVRRAQLLPCGGDLSDEVFDQLGAKTQAALTAAGALERITMSEAAKQIWIPFYYKSDDDASGLVDELTARDTAQTLRLALVYALIDGAASIEPAHVEAAIAVWEYCDASARYIFGDASGDTVDDTILGEVRAAGIVGMSRTQILRDVFQRNTPASKIAPALERLESAGKIRREMHKPSIGRPREVWFAV